MEPRLRRSLLYVPASSEAMLRKAGSRGADVLIVDLEDGVLPDAKDAARAQAESLWLELDLGSAEVLLRVNAPGTPWHEADVEAASRIRPAGLVLPKCEDPAAVAGVAARLGGTPLFLMVETARGALVLAARAAGIEAYDTPFFEYRDDAGLERSARRARTLGFDGKTAIHPAQVAVVNRVFAPTAEEVERARAIVAALEGAAREGRGVATVAGEMVEALHAAEARRTLARARQAGLA